MDTPIKQKYLPSRHLASFLDGSQKLCFYPSCGYRSIKDIFNLPYEVFVFSDHDKSVKGKIMASLKNSDPGFEVLTRSECARVVKYKGKVGFFLFRDNAYALRVISKAKGRISGVVGICCGCSENDNSVIDYISHVKRQSQLNTSSGIGNVGHLSAHECVTSMSYLAKLVPLINDNADYFIDHAQNAEFHDCAKERNSDHWHFKSWEGHFGRRKVQFIQVDTLTIQCRSEESRFSDFRTRDNYGYEKGILERSDVSPLWKLVNFRLSPPESPIIAHYKVKIL